MALAVGLALVALLAFVTEGAIGFGGTIIAVSVGAQLVPLDELLPAFVPISMALSLWLAATGWRAIAWRVLAVEVAPLVAAGAAVGLVLFHLPAKRALAIAFGVFVAALATLQLARPAVRPLRRRWRAAMLGAGGVAHGLFGTGGPMIVYVLRRRIAEPRVFRATLAVLWLALNTAVIANLAALELFTPASTERGLAMAAAVVPGLWLGERLHRALDAARFERAVWLLLLAAGAALAIRMALA